MDQSRIAALAARHRALQQTAHALSEVDNHQATERLRQQVDEYWTQLGDECDSFCRTYNGAFGADRLYCQRHTDTIVVRSADDPQETVTVTRTSLTNPHGGHITAHRYSSHASPVDLSIEGHVEGQTFTLASGGRPVTPAEAAFVLLERFTEELAGQRAAEEVRERD